MKDDNKMIGHIIALMKRGVSVAIVTAAGKLDTRLTPSAFLTSTNSLIGIS